MSDSAKLRLPREGYIKLGIKDPSRRGAPKNVDYFVCPPQIYKALGVDDPTKLKELSVYFPVDDLDLVFSANWKRYVLSGGKSKLTCRAQIAREDVLTLDKEKYTGQAYRLAQDNQTWNPLSCNPQCPYRKDNTCKSIGSLMFLIDGVASTGCWEYDVKSVATLRELEMILRSAKAQFGTIQNIPFVLYIKQVGSGTRRGYVAGLRIDPRFTSAMKTRNPFLAALEQGQIPQLGGSAPVKALAVEAPPSGEDFKALWTACQQTGRSKEALLDDVQRFFGKESPRELTLTQLKEMIALYQSETEDAEELA